MKCQNTSFLANNKMETLLLVTVIINEIAKGKGYFVSEENSVKLNAALKEMESSGLAKPNVSGKYVLTPLGRLFIEREIPYHIWLLEDRFSKGAIAKDENVYDYLKAINSSEIADDSPDIEKPASVSKIYWIAGISILVIGISAFLLFVL
jgi:hypothetical protein